VRGRLEEVPQKKSVGEIGCLFLNGAASLPLRRGLNSKMGSNYHLKSYLTFLDAKRKRKETVEEETEMSGRGGSHAMRVSDCF